MTARMKSAGTKNETIDAVVIRSEAMYTYKEKTVQGKSVQGTSKGLGRLEMRNPGVIQCRLKPVRDMEKLKEYVMEKDIPVIRKYCMDKSYAISFRRAGRYTIDKLGKGAAAKGHHILEKSIKEKTIDNEEHFRSLPEEVKGLVGYWYADEEAESGESKEKEQTLQGVERLMGLQMSQQGLKKLMLSRVPKRAIKEQAVSFAVLDEVIERALSSEEKNNFPRETSRVNQRLRSLRLVAYAISKNIFAYSDFITGDYDLHDLIYIDRIKERSGGIRMPSAAVKDGLNEALNGRRTSHSEFDRIQHGPQADYSNYIMAHRREDFKSQLMRADVSGAPPEPVAMCGPDGIWYIIDNRADLKEFYKKHGIKIELVWPEGKALELLEERVNIVRGGARK